MRGRNTQKGEGWRCSIIDLRHTQLRGVSKRIDKMLT